MKLDDFKPVTKGAFPRLVARVPDARGAEEFELTLSGPRALLERALAEATIELTIDSPKANEEWKRELETAQEELRGAMWEAAALESVDELLKPDPGPLQRKTTVFAAIRPVKGHGTPFGFTVSPFFVPAGASFVFLGSWVLSTFARVIPASGDQDLFLHLFNPLGPIVSASVFGGTTTDVVAFASPPPFFFFPFFRVRGFAAGTCSSFLAMGI
jgi:hypothetical protein